MAKERKHQPNPEVIEIPKGCPKCGKLQRTRTHTYFYPDRPLLVGPITHRGRVTRRYKCACGFNYLVSSPIPSTGGPIDADKN